MPTDTDVHFMQLALNKAVQGKAAHGGAEVGCVLVLNGAAAESDYNEVERRNDPTAHSEIVAMRSLCAKLKQSELRGYSLYCTLQPCGMCTLACVWSGISRIVYGAPRDAVNAMYFETRTLNTKDLVADCFRSDMSITGGVLREECCRLYFGPEEDASGLMNPAHEDTI